MAKPGRATQEKRNRERAKKEKAQNKEADRVLRKELKRQRDDLTADGVDPDLVGIIAGPQPPQLD